MKMMSYNDASNSLALAERPDIKIKKIKATLDPMTKGIQIRMTKPIGPIARTANAVYAPDACIEAKAR